MIREEALVRVRGYLTNWIPLEDSGEIDEIMEALEQEPCEDAVSRKAVSEIVCRSMNYLIEYATSARLPKIQEVICEQFASTAKQIYELSFVAPQKTAHWIEHPHEAGLDWEYSMYECCGGQVDPAAMKCEYCGTTYRLDENYKPIMIQTYMAPTHTFAVKTKIDSTLLSLYGRDYTDMVVREISSQLAERLLPYIEYRIQPSFEDIGLDLYSTIRVCEPTIGSETLDSMNNCLSEKIRRR